MDWFVKAFVKASLGWLGAGVTRGGSPTRGWLGWSPAPDSRHTSAVTG